MSSSLSDVGNYPRACGFFFFFLWVLGIITVQSGAFTLHSPYCLTTTTTTGARAQGEREAEVSRKKEQKKAELAQK